MELKRATLEFELKEVSQAGEFEGLASTFGNIDFGNDVVVKGAFLESLAAWSAKGQLPLMTWFHSMNTPIGDFLRIEENEKGLYVKGRIWVGEKVTDTSKTAYNMLTGTGPKGLSIGYVVKESKDELIDGEIIRILQKVELMEIAVVPFGMNDQAVITQAKSLVSENGEIADIRTVEKALRDAGFSSKQAKTLLSKGYNALSRDEKNDNEIKLSLENLLTSFKEK